LRGEGGAGRRSAGCHHVVAHWQQAEAEQSNMVSVNRQWTEATGHTTHHRRSAQREMRMLLTAVWKHEIDLVVQVGVIRWYKQKQRGRKTQLLKLVADFYL